MSAIRNDDDDGRPAHAGDDLAAGDEGRPAAAAARVRLAALRRDAAAVYDSIVAADGELRALADLRVAAERALLAAGKRRDQAESALNEHARAGSGLLARLAAGLGADQARRSRHAGLTAALDDCARSVATARRAYAQAQSGLAATVAARAEAAARLRGLTEECAAAQRAALDGDSAAPGSVP